jgi:Kef-type K+ transport system membrane component KefB
MGLLLLSYAGSFLVGSRAVRGGLPAGTEYVLLGFVLGPTVLGLVERSMLATVEPVAHAALGWLAFVLGLQYGFNHGRRVRTVRMLGSWLGFLFTGAAIAAAVWGVLAGLGRFLGAPFDAGDRLLVAGGVGAASAETTRYAVRWVVEKDRAQGPVADLVGDLAESDDLVPVLVVAALFAHRPDRDLVAQQTPWFWFAVTLLLGAVLGGMAAVLLGRTFRLAEAWAVMLGMAMLTIGTASRLGLCAMAAMFVMGAAISLFSRHRDDITSMIGPTERPVVLPVLLLAGASVDPSSQAMALHPGEALAAAAPVSRWLPVVLIASVLARIAAKTLVGLAVLAVAPRARRAGPRLGLALCSTGALSTSLGLTFALRFPGAIGGTVLASAALSLVVGEILGPRSLRACLRRAGEVPEDPAPVEAPGPQPEVPRDEPTTLPSPDPAVPADDAGEAQPS